MKVVGCGEEVTKDLLEHLSKFEGEGLNQLIDKYFEQYFEEKRGLVFDLKHYSDLLKTEGILDIWKRRFTELIKNCNGDEKLAYKLFFKELIKYYINSFGIVNLEFDRVTVDIGDTFNEIIYDGEYNPTSHNAILERTEKELEENINR